MTHHDPDLETRARQFAAQGRAEHEGSLEALLADRLARQVEALLRERLAAESDPLAGKSALPIDDVARVLSVDADTVRRYIRAGHLEAVQPVPGGRVLVPVWSIRRLLKEGAPHGTPSEAEADAPHARRGRALPAR